MTEPTEQSMKTQAQEIMVAVDKDLQQVESQSPEVQAEVTSITGTILDTVFGVINDVDIESATKRVDELRKSYPEATPVELSQKLISEKSKKTGTVGAVTASAGLIPGLGTATAMTLGVAADIGATFKLQAELVLEIAAAYDYPLTEEEKQRIVMFITGLSAGTASLTRRAGQTAAVRIGEKLAATSAEKAFAKALPVVGVIASAGTNVLSTYIIGQRADAYFRLGPEAVGSWSESLRAITGIDERTITTWLAETGRYAGGAVVSGAGAVAETVGSGLSTGGRVTRNVVVMAVLAIWSGIVAVLGFIWFVISFIPRKIFGLFRRSPQIEAETPKKLPDEVD